MLAALEASASRSAARVRSRGFQPRSLMDRNVQGRPLMQHMSYQGSKFQMKTTRRSRGKGSLEQLSYEDWIIGPLVP